LHAHAHTYYRLPPLPSAGLPRQKKMKILTLVKTRFRNIKIVTIKVFKFQPFKKLNYSN